MAEQPLQFDTSALRRDVPEVARFELALLDLDGTLWRGNDVIDGASEFVERLRDAGIRPVFFTNNSSRTPESVVAALHRMGFTASVDEVCTSAQAAADAVSQRVAEPGAIVAYVGEKVCARHCGRLDLTLAGRTEKTFANPGWSRHTRLRSVSIRLRHMPISHWYPVSHIAWAGSH
ncbi:hypothetical protein [Alicyclobacillus sacchari]|uniref:hypothetical protein n=1 Tax=Alicyclobacillus sacchari TaxID=392010 RepID=UPI0024E16D12|nr:hypothetical protein [Alicyclobacillus sacchari]